MTPPTNIVLVWMRNNLRTHDNCCLTYASSLNADVVAPVFVVDSRLCGMGARTWKHLKRLGVHRAKFLSETVADLHAALARLGSVLITHAGISHVVLGSVARALLVHAVNRQAATSAAAQRLGDSETAHEPHVILTLVYSEEWAPEEMEIAEAVVHELEAVVQSVESSALACELGLRIQLRVQIEYDLLLYKPSDMPFRSVADAPDQLTAFAAALADTPVCAPVPPPEPGSLPLGFLYSALSDVTAPELALSTMAPRLTAAPSVFPHGDLRVAPASDAVLGDESLVTHFMGGERAALERMQRYVFDERSLETYKKTRNSVAGQAYSSKFAAWLANGSLSARQIHATLRQASETMPAQSVDFLHFELQVREFYRWYLWKHREACFRWYGVNGLLPSGTVRPELRHYTIGRSEAPADETREAAFEAWVCGRTGYPFVDAAMRELYHTGFQAHRSRLNCASFLVMDLCVDWRLGADYYEAMLIDYDVSINYGNWHAVTGLGATRFHHYNVVSDGKQYDPRGLYVRAWVPELARLPDEYVHCPWQAPADVLAAAGVRLGETYPQRVWTLRWGRGRGAGGSAGGGGRGSARSHAVPPGTRRLAGEVPNEHGEGDEAGDQVAGGEAGPVDV